MDSLLELAVIRSTPIATGRLPRLVVAGLLVSLASASAQETRRSIRDDIDRWHADRGSIRSFYNLPMTLARKKRLEALGDSVLLRLRNETDFASLTPGEKIDYLLFKNEVSSDGDSLKFEQKEAERLVPFVPFAGDIDALEQARRDNEAVNPRVAADRVAKIKTSVAEMQKRVAKAESRPASAPSDQLTVDPETAVRAADVVTALREVLSDWYRNLAEYDPVFTWWVKAPYDEAMKALGEYGTKLRKELAGLKGEDADPLIGRPIGREALEVSLAHEFLPYKPEELMAIAEKHFAWCESEMRKASAEMGLGDNWREALLRVKADSVPPGEQGPYIAGLAKEAVKFCDDHQLVTIPDLCRDTWRIEMESPAAQRTLPFASYGGQHITVAYPTADMDHDRKLMVMRGNNKHFTRLVTPHELIPGHHLQGYIAARASPSRRSFGTPFFVEGWAVYGEMLFWKLGFCKTPEDRIGALFWRMHRCARIIVSLKFHLGEMTPAQMIDYLVDRVGHERDGATGEVRRYIGGGYGPLYQCGYLIGALQLWKLREEMGVDGGESERRFHDLVLAQGAIPIELVRLAIGGKPFGRDYAPSWRFN